MTRTLGALLLALLAACGGGEPASAARSPAASEDVHAVPEATPPAGQVAGWCPETLTPALEEPIVQVWPSGPDEVWAVTQGRFYTGSLLRVVAGRVEHHLDLERGDTARLWGSGADEVWLVSGGTFRWDGARWREVPGGPERADAIWGSGRGAIWFVDGSDVARLWDGAAFTEVELPAGVAPTAVSGSGSGDVWFAGRGLAHFDGTGVRRVDAPGDATHPLLSVAASGPGDAWAVGVGRVLRLDGTRWREVPGPDAGSCLLAWTAGGDDAWFVCPSRLHTRQEGGWSVAPGLDVELYAIAGPPAIARASGHAGALLRRCE